MNYSSKTANGANSKGPVTRAISRGAVGGRGSSKILQRNNVISNNEIWNKKKNDSTTVTTTVGSPNLNNGTKSKAIGSIIDEDKYMIKDKQVNGIHEITGPSASSKYNKSKSMAPNKLPAEK